MAGNKELLLPYDETEHVAIFVSHNWWQTAATASRVETDAGGGAANAADDDRPSSPRSPAKMKFDTGLPDYTTGEKANLKFRVLLSGVAALIQKDALDEGKVVLWMEYVQSALGRPSQPILHTHTAHPRVLRSPVIFVLVLNG